MQPRFETLAPTPLVGLRARMTLAADRSPELWRRFMPRRHEVPGRVEGRYISMAVRDRVSGADPSGLLPVDTPFDRWVAVEVNAAGGVPEGMESHIRSGGLYAVFVHRGPASAAPRTWGYIFGTWLPASQFELDDREHFEVLPEGYRPDDPAAEEEVWIPVRPRRAAGGEP
jgi:AraC family transcriptional regulator